MNEKSKHNNIGKGYLATLEEVKKQYQQYIEVSKLYDVTNLLKAKPTAVEKTITTNTFIPEE